MALSGKTQASSQCVPILAGYIESMNRLTAQQQRITIVLVALAVTYVISAMDAATSFSGLITG